MLKQRSKDLFYQVHENFSRELPLAKYSRLEFLVRNFANESFMAASILNKSLIEVVMYE